MVKLTLLQLKPSYSWMFGSRFEIRHSSPIFSGCNEMGVIPDTNRQPGVCECVCAGCVFVTLKSFVGFCNFLSSTNETLGELGRR